MKNYLLLLMVLIALTSSAQDCDKELLAQKPGTWKASQQDVIKNVTATDLTKEKAVIAAIHKMVSTNYKPTGCEVSYSIAFGKHLPAAKIWIADPFQYTMYILKFMCDINSTDKSKYNVQISTSTTVNIYANRIGWIGGLYAATLPDDEPRGYLKMKNKPQIRDGFYYSEETLGDSTKPQFVKVYQWLITYNDALPFMYVSQKEYLLLTKKKLEKTIDQAGSYAAYYNKYMNNINDYLKKPESELSNPAICMWNDEESFEGFVEEGTRGSFYAIKPNPDYYKKLPMSSPQFFTVVYKVVHGDPVYDENISNIKKAVDFEVLKNMLGK
jgi:hypothetical protein